MVAVIVVICQSVLYHLDCYCWIVVKLMHDDTSITTTTATATATLRLMCHMCDKNVKSQP